MTDRAIHKYDVIVIGAGAGGGVAAALLAEAGKTVLLLERGRRMTFADVGRDHLRNQRLSQHGVNAGPNLADNPRVFVDPQGRSRIIDATDGAYQNNAAAVGGGTQVYGAQAWRYLPDDFRMASKYGVPAGSGLADWPISYEELAPYYERAEWELGVAGDEADAGRNRPRHKEYPMPPLPLNIQGRVLRAGAQALGWDTQHVPLLINSVPRQGRDACAHCQQCVGFACPTDAKNGTHNTMIPRALATGLCTLETEAMTERVIADGAGRATGVVYWNSAGEQITATSEVVVLSGGAVETARLMLNSKTDAHPNGLGNDHDMVGRNFQGHFYAGAVGWMDDSVWDGVGPGPTTATIRFNHDNDGIVGGGMLCDDFIMQPINFVKGSVPRGVPRWGKEHKEWVRHNYTRMLRVFGPVHDIPSPDARISVDPDVRDRWGIPVVRISGATHPETLRVHAFMNARAEEWLRASGAKNIHSDAATLSLSGGQHQAGTCRMGHDPKTSVTDTWGRVHGFDNLYIADGSLHVTNGGFNPVLTILALAFRVAGHIAESW
ncbi:gluconate dehydrogenase [Capsulimonas corticalis]|uniref:Gluconate dehydrogenase n=1 Tax=Capsulimonas corticalis TaxID=2219043 RepID=A0A402CZT7_9BACT|nr:GMC family oxidoreductase [Capsulimonas corticalis]BDI33880.1 gluconate dehydrogenase [Capsulimonas corticalis]